MSSSSAGQFQDHYDLLGIDPKADSDAVQHAYARLAAKYQPKSDTADPEKFAAVNLAFEVLSDSELRGSFDKLKGVDREHGTPRFSGAQFFEAIGRETSLRKAILSILYDRRRTKPGSPSLSMRHLENMIAASSVELAFTLWYLKQRGQVANDDKSSLQITVEGMEYLETNRPHPDEVMSFIKPAARADSPTGSAESSGALSSPSVPGPLSQTTSQPAAPPMPAALLDPSPIRSMSPDASTSSMLKINLALSHKRPS